MIFKNKHPNRAKLLSIGFSVDGEAFMRREAFPNGFTLTITIKGGEVTTHLADADGEPYTLHLVEGASGSFVGTVKAEYERVLQDVAARCFEDEPFKFAQTLRLIKHLRERFDGAPEFLWEKFPSYAVFRREDNRKWYAVIMTIPRRKLELADDAQEELEILNVRVEPEDLNRLVDGEKYFRGWHMNKRSWLTLRLDDALTDAEVFERLEKSFLSAIMATR